MNEGWMVETTFYNSSGRPCSSSLKWSTCPLLLDCWLLSHVIFLKLRKNNCSYKLTKWQLFLLKMATSKLLSEVVVTISCIFSAWDKSRVKWVNSPKTNTGRGSKRSCQPWFYEKASNELNPYSTSANPLLMFCYNCCLLPSGTVTSCNR